MFYPEPPLSCRLHSYCWILSEDRLEYGKVYSEMWIERIYNLFRSLSTQQCQVSSNTQTWWKIVPWIDAYKIKVSRIYIPPNYYIFITFIFEHWHKLGFIIRSWKLSLGILFSDFQNMSKSCVNCRFLSFQFIFITDNCNTDDRQPQIPSHVSQSKSKSEYKVQLRSPKTKSRVHVKTLKSKL